MLRRTFETLTEDEYYAVFTRIIRYGRKSLLINIVVVIPPVGLILYLAAYRLKDVLFFIGALTYGPGALVLSRLFNEPTSTHLLSTPRTDREAIPG